MPLGRFFRSLVDNEVMGEEIVSANVKSYEAAKRLEPNRQPVDWLAAAYLGRMRARRREMLPAAAYIFCEFIMHVPEPYNARVLGLMMLQEERPDIWSNFPKFSLELSSYFDRYGWPGEDEKAQVRDIKKAPVEKVNKTKFVCPSCGFESKVPNGQKGVVTCPDCQSKTTINKDGSIVSHAAGGTEEQATESAEKTEKIDKKFYEDAADRYAKQKEDNRRNQALGNRPKMNVRNIPEPGKSSSGISIEWLRENAEYFERKKARGEHLSDYEQGLIDQYKAAQKQEYTETADSDDRARLKRGFEKSLKKEISQNTRRMTIVGVGGGGCEIIDLIRNMEIEDVDWIALDRSADRLSHISCPDKIYIDFESPDADEDQVELLKIFCENRDHVVFITRLGGAYGSFMVQLIADEVQVSEDSRIHLIATLPFQFEGKQRMEVAENALSECRSKIKNILVLKNQELFSKSGEKTTFRDAMEITASEAKNYISSL